MPKGFPPEIKSVQAIFYSPFGIFGESEEAQMLVSMLETVAVDHGTLATLFAGHDIQTFLVAGIVKYFGHAR